MGKMYDEIEKKGHYKRDPVEMAIYALHRVSKSHRDMAEVAAEVYAEKVAELESLQREVSQLHVQLAGCLIAAEGAKQEVFAGDYGWSPAYQSVIELRKLYEKGIEHG